ncbi:MAG: hydantoinase B/oxoprolinase family protein, partial [Arenicellales bacterium]|nr:hydantoinase B/oxoprolinase family protein [Arenicellales bacterium]
MSYRTVYKTTSGRKIFDQIMKSDPVTLELFKNALFSIADEMAVTICRTTYSGVLRDNMDFSTAFTDAQGKLVAQGLTIPLHLGSIPT